MSYDGATEVVLEESRHVVFHLARVVDDNLDLDECGVTTRGTEVSIDLLRDPKMTSRCTQRQIRTETHTYTEIKTTIHKPPYNNPFHPTQVDTTRTTWT